MAKPLIYCGRATHKLGTAVVRELRNSLGDLDVELFADEELWFRVEDFEEVPGRDVFIIQSTPKYAPTSYFDMWGIMDAVRRQNPRRLVVVMPYMGFSRQEKDLFGGEAVMADLMARFIVTAGADEVILCDPHAGIIKQFFSLPEHLCRKFSIDSSIPHTIPVQVIDANPLFQRVLQERSLTNYVVVTPDAGGKDVANRLARSLDLPLVIAHKHRPGPDEAKSEGVEGDVRGKKAVIREDIISTAGTIIATVRELMKAGASEVIILATHGVLAGGAVQKLKREEAITEVWITDSIYLPWEKRIDKIKIVSLAPAIAKIIQKMAA